MAKKAELIEQASKLGLKLADKATIAEIEAAIASVAKDENKAEVAVVEKSGIAKAGKRSSKSLKESEEKIAKEERKEAGDTSPQSDEVVANTQKGPKPITRPLIERRGKNYRKVAELVDKTKFYPLQEAMELAVKTNPSKFDASVEIHARLGVDPKQADQNIRTTVVLPHGTGKTIRVAVFAPEVEQKSAKTAGADIVGDEELLKLLDQGQIGFDVLISTPKFMPRLGKYARLLGPKGLMPNPKSGTVATDIAKAVAEAKAGKVEYRVDKQAIVHLSVGKVSFGADKLTANAQIFFDSLRAQKPASLKGIYIKSVAISTSQGPSIKLENIAA